MKKHLPPLLIMIILLGWLWVPTGLKAFNHSYLEWKTVKTENFAFHFHQGTEFTASLVYQNAEKILKPMLNKLDFQLKDTLHVVIRDEIEKANAFAIFSHSHITLWSTPMDVRERVPSQGILYVFAHELAHVITLKMASHLSEHIPDIHFDMELQDRIAETDLISDFSLLWSNHSKDLWWAEGIAEYMSSELDLTTWNSSRDMLLRSALLEDNHLVMDELPSIVDKSKLRAELVYNQGYDIHRYIASTYGKDSVRKLAQNAALKMSSLSVLKLCLKVGTLIAKGNTLNRWKSCPPLTKVNLYLPPIPIFL